MTETLQEIARSIAGEIRQDRLYRALYSCDASIYQMMPAGVVLPKNVEDVAATVKLCAEHGVSITPRGAGTGLTGGAVNRGIILDCSRHMQRIHQIDPGRRIAVVQAGVVLDELNAAAAAHGLHFAPDVATSSRATIGGMIANNSCGAHSVLYGRTCDHVLGVDVVLSDGSRQTWGGIENVELRMEKRASALGRECEETLQRVSTECADEIAVRYPKVMRRNGGYALDRLKPGGGRINAETIVCGSEGTLCIVVGAVLKLTPLPKHRGMVVAHFGDLLDALAATPMALEHRPAAVELLDHFIIEAARASPGMADRIRVVEGDPRGVLVIELYDEDSAELEARLRALAADLHGKRMGYAWPVILDAARQCDVWNVRKAGLGLLMSKPGDRHPYDFVDDTAVDPSRLREYIARFRDVLCEEGVEDCSYYAHASVGCLHVKPILNLKRRDEVERMYRVADRISSLALEFGGAMTGEHGDGLVRSVWIEKMFGPRLTEAFRQIKAAFDPKNILNPGKIVAPLPMTENLRWQPNAVVPPPRETMLDFSLHGGVLGAAEMCSGVGQCRQRLVGTMCPSYAATGDELHTTRARANALRLALADRSMLDGLDDPALDEVMDLCISCKACKTECPTAVDMAKLKTEWLHRRNEQRGASRRSRLVARSAEWIERGARFPRISNRIATSRTVRRFLDRRLGLDARVPFPRFAAKTFLDWFGSRRPRSGPAPKDSVVYFVDTWMNYFTPEVGMAAVGVLESLGLEVALAPTVCCRRPAISKGFLHEAKAAAERNIEVLAPFADAGLAIVGTEPSCILTFVDEAPQLVRSAAARRVAAASMTIETFLAGRMGAMTLTKPGLPILYHGHCHQKAMVGAGDAMTVLSALGSAHEINSGCCGMAGSFGHESEHYETAQAIGEQRLFPAVRARGDATIAVSGFSCRHQIEHHTGVRPRHVIELVGQCIES